MTSKLKELRLKSGYTMDTVARELGIDYGELVLFEEEFD